MRQRKIIPGVDPRLLIKDAAKLMPAASRRGFLRGAASLGALTFLTGCDIIDSDAAEGVLRKISAFNDGAQAVLFSRTKLAPTYPESAITKPFPFNAYYDEDEAPQVDGKSYKLEVAGLVENKKSWTLDELYALPQVSQITRHVCVEGWSAIGSWQGTPLSEFLQRVGADTRAKYVWFKCAEGYTNTIDMPTALHPQTQMTFKYRQRDLAARLRLPDEDPHAHQARLQEPEIRGGDGSHQYRQGRLLGKPGLQLVQRAVAAWCRVFRQLIPALGLLRRCFQRCQQRGEEFLIGAPTPDGVLIDWLANLRRARRLHRPIGLVKGQAAVVPGQAAMREDTPRLSLEIGDHVLVTDIEDATRRQHPPPMFHELLIAAIVAADFAEIVSVGLRADPEQTRETGNAGVHRVAN